MWLALLDSILPFFQRNIFIAGFSIDCIFAKNVAKKKASKCLVWLAAWMFFCCFIYKNRRIWLSIGFQKPDVCPSFKWGSQYVIYFFPERFLIGWGVEPSQIYGSRFFLKKLLSQNVVFPAPLVWSCFATLFCSQDAFNRRRQNLLKRLISGFSSYFQLQSSFRFVVSFDRSLSFLPIKVRSHVTEISWKIQMLHQSNFFALY